MIGEGQIREDDSEAGEAEGLESVEMTAHQLSDEEGQELDRQTVGELDDEFRRQVGDSGAIRLSPNFVLTEFQCCRGHCPGANVPGNAVRGLRELVNEVLQPMRNKFGRCRVHSGYRNVDHNRHVGGAAKSRHRHDLFPNEPGADVSFANGSVAEWAAEARRLLGNNRGGVGTYAWGIHVDLGPPRRW